MKTTPLPRRLLHVSVLALLAGCEMDILGGTGQSTPSFPLTGRYEGHWRFQVSQLYDIEAPYATFNCTGSISLNVSSSDANVRSMTGVIDNTACAIEYDENPQVTPGEPVLDVTPDSPATGLANWLSDFWSFEFTGSSWRTPELLFGCPSFPSSSPVHFEGYARRSTSGSVSLSGGTRESVGFSCSGRQLKVYITFEMSRAG